MTGRRADPRPGDDPRPRGDPRPELVDAAHVRAALRRADVAVVGPAGSGRSHALAVVVAGRRRTSTLRIAGARGLERVPLGALLALLDDDTGPDGADEFGVLAARVRERIVAARTPRLLVVDDAHLLDEVSLGLLRTLHGACRLLLSVADDQPAGPALVDLLDETVHVHPRPLSDDEVAGAAHARLGAPLDLVSARRLADVTGGRPGHLDRVLDAGAGHLERAEGRVWLPPDLGALPRLRPWTESRLDGCTTAARRACRLLARDEGLAATALARVVGAPALAELRSRRLVVPAGDGGPRLRDPLLRAVLAATDAADADADDAADLLGALRGTAPAALVARWAVVSGAPVETEALVGAVLGALRDGRLELALRLTASEVDDPRLLALRGEALAGAGRIKEALELVERSAAGDEPVVAGRARLLLADLRFFRLGDPDGALAAATGPPTGDADLDAELEGFAHLVRSAVGAAGPAGSGARAPDGPSVVRLVVDLRSILAGTADPDRDVDALRDAVPALLEPRARTNAWFHALLFRDVATAEGLASEDVQAALRTGRPGAVGLALGGLAVARQLRGELDAAEGMLREARRHLRGDDESGVRGAWQAAHATVLAELGRRDEAAGLRSAGPVDGAPADVRWTLLGGGADIRSLAGTDRAAAAERTLELLDLGVATGHGALAVLAAHHAVRIGLARTVAGAVVDAVAPMRGRPLQAIGAHAAAAAAGDPAELRAAADGLVAVGMRRVAAEATLHAAGLERESAVAERDRRRAATLLDVLGPPLLVPRDAVEVLSPRERQVADLAAAGSTSRAAAEVLGLSVRTVDNHLRSVYRKLGVTGRDQLGPLLRG